MNAETQNNHIETTSAVTQAAHPPLEHHGEEGGLLTINGTLVVIVASFIVFTVLMQKILYGPITEIRNRRSDYLKKMKEEANEAFIESEKLSKDYQESIKEARKKVAEKTAEQLNQANDEKNKMLEEKKQEISGYLTEQKQIIQNEKNTAVEVLKAQVMDYAYNISKKVLGEEVSMAGLSNEVIDRALYETER